MTASQRAIFSLLVEERDDYMSCIVFDIWKFCFVAGQKEEIIPPKNQIDHQKIQDTYCNSRWL